jgi:Leucine-rich repeat (LRR) protein
VNHPSCEGSCDSTLGHVLRLFLAIACLRLPISRAELAGDSDSITPGALQLCVADSPSAFTAATISGIGQSPSANGGDEAKELEFFKRLDADRVNKGAAKGVQHIRVLDLSRTQVQDDELDNLAHVLNLSFLDLSFTSITDRGLRKLEHLQLLDILNLTGTKITGAGLASVGRLAHVAILHLDCTDVRGGLDHLKSRRSLQNLSLRGAIVAEDDLVQLGALVELERLDVARTGTNARFLKAFKNPRSMASLTLRENMSIDNETCGYLPPFANLTLLDVGYTKIGDDGLVNVCKLSDLRELDIGGTSVGDRGLTFLSRLTKLTSLNLESTTVSRLGIESLRPLTHLNSLKLRNTHISDTACTALGQWGSLQHVDISGTGITENGLIELCKSRSLRSVVVTASVASPKTIARLQAERKGLVIECEEATARPEARSSGPFEKRHERFDLDRFDQVVVESFFTRVSAAVFLPVAGDRDDGCVPDALLSSQPSCHLVPVDAG